MEHHDHVSLLRPARISPGGTWADLGAGRGAFTLALRELAGTDASIHAVDRDRAALESLQRNYTTRFGSASGLQTLHADISKDMPLPPLDGVLMANSLHFFRDKQAVMEHVRSCLKPGGMLLLVEYNTDHGNPWVPYPLSFEPFRGLALAAGFTGPRLLATRPSSFMRGFYSAQAFA